MQLDVSHQVYESWFMRPASRPPHAKAGTALRVSAALCQAKAIPHHVRVTAVCDHVSPLEMHRLTKASTIKHSMSGLGLRSR